MTQHRMTPDGESTEHWAFREPGFMGSVKQILNCARCGQMPPPKGKDHPLHVRNVGKPTIHMLCDECWEALP